MNDNDRRAIDAMKAAMMPALDAALVGWMSTVKGAVSEATAAETDRCIVLVDMCRKRADAPPGWTAAIEFAVQTLREWKVESAESESKEPKP